MRVADAPLRAAIYLRISQDRELDGLAIERQREDCENVVAQHKMDCSPSWYTQSKWVSEQMVAEAGRRGLPTYIYRAGRVAGHSETGACQTYDFVWRAVKAAVEMGSAPDVDMLIDITPVDYVVAALVHIAGRPELAGQAFHLVSPAGARARPGRLDGRSGYVAERLRFEQWCAKIVDRAAHLSDRTAGALAPFFSGILPLDEMPPATFRADAVEAALEDSDITCPPITPELIGRYLDYFVQVGFLSSAEDQRASTREMERSRRQCASTTPAARTCSWSRTSRRLPPPGTVLVKVGVSGVNYTDVMARQGIYMSRESGRDQPRTMGTEVAGVVTAVGEGSSRTSSVPGGRLCRGRVCRVRRCRS